MQSPGGTGYSSCVVSGSVVINSHNNYAAFVIMMMTMIIVVVIRLILDISLLSSALPSSRHITSNHVSYSPFQQVIHITNTFHPLLTPSSFLLLPSSLFFLLLLLLILLPLLFPPIQDSPRYYPAISLAPPSSSPLNLLLA